MIMNINQAMALRSHLEPVKGIVIQYNRKQAGIGRTSAGHDISGVKIWKEQSPQHQVEEDHRRHHRDGDVEELLKGGGAVDFSRLVEVLGNALQTGQEDHHRGADLHKLIMIKAGMTHSG